MAPTMPCAVRLPRLGTPTLTSMPRDYPWNHHPAALHLGMHQKAAAGRFESPGVMSRSGPLLKAGSTCPNWDINSSTNCRSEIPASSPTVLIPPDDVSRLDDISVRKPPVSNRTDPHDSPSAGTIRAVGAPGDAARRRASDPERNALYAVAASIAATASAPTVVMSLGRRNGGARASPAPCEPTSRACRTSASASKSRNTAPCTSPRR